MSAWYGQETGHDQSARGPCLLGVRIYRPVGQFSPELAPGPRRRLQRNSVKALQAIAPRMYKAIQKGTSVSALRAGYGRQNFVVIAVANFIKLHYQGTQSVLRKLKHMQAPMFTVYTEEERGGGDWT